MFTERHGVFEFVYGKDPINSTDPIWKQMAEEEESSHLSNNLLKENSESENVDGGIIRGSTKLISPFNFPLSPVCIFDSDCQKAF
jgi:hypothetical protein